MRSPKLILLAWGLAFVAARADPRPITVGDGTVTGDHFQPYTNRWEYSVKLPGKDLLKVGIWSDEMTAATVDGHAAFIRKQVAGNYKNDKTTVTLNTFDAHTLAPLRREWIDRNPANYTRLKFSGKIISVERIASGPQPGPAAAPPEPVATGPELTLAAPVFDFHGGMWGMVLAGAPLKVGLEGTFQTLDEFGPTVSTVKFRVVREEETSAGPGKKVMAFVVETDSEKSGHLVFWITPHAPYIIRLSFLAGNGAEFDYRML